ncbi:DoxX family protein [Cocleimonas sp. KMM 6892]|jgi:putative oxidoreductase|uniref:DoxX family protein n=1 Tax=unclassified Cocleimonas TaxID=2639732 RepID=UPI002DC01D33|nr:MULTISPECIES: DoxX family protein [unclassified Cocleimonas]MEB8433060.1 DoxX family protein [Cocleimonas sp. KMM 6892]MEC4715959.1 DoxX family protein [Cocleimonas sp. KMM 6895]MEC4745420.1 DoxX family protein [Cocleimonas sp. KMM 6896]
MNTALNATLNTTMKTPLLNRIFTTDESLSSLILRIPIGVIFIAHGGQKLFGLFGGYGLEGTAKWMASIGLEPGYLMALMAGSAELFGGLALILGLLVRPAALVLAVTMLVAIFSVHFSNGLFISNKGYEFALALFAASAALVFSGAGRFSLDGIISK